MDCDPTDRLSIEGDRMMELDCFDDVRTGLEVIVSDEGERSMLLLEVDCSSLLGDRVKVGVLVLTTGRSHWVLRLT